MQKCLWCGKETNARWFSPMGDVLALHAKCGQSIGDTARIHKRTAEPCKHPNVEPLGPRLMCMECGREPWPHLRVAAKEAAVAEKPDVLFYSTLIGTLVVSFATFVMILMGVI